jgi:hypothetical protein
MQMDQRLEMNNIRDFLKILPSTTNNGLNVKKKYEVRKPFLLNIDLVLNSRKVLIKGQSKLSDPRLPSESVISLNNLNYFSLL